MALDIHLFSIAGLLEWSNRVMRITIINIDVVPRPRVVDDRVIRRPHGGLNSPDVREDHRLELAPKFLSDSSDPGRPYPPTPSS